MKTNKKLLVLTTSYPNTKNPSAGTFVASFALSMSELVDVEVLAPSSCRSELLPVAGVACHTFRYAPNAYELLAQRGGGVPSALRNNRFLIFLVPIFLLSYFCHVFHIIRRFDLVQANWVVSGLVSLLPCLIYRKTLVVTMHGEDVRKLLASSLHRFLVRLLLCGGCSLVVVGRELHRSVLGLYRDKEARIHFIPNGVDEVCVNRCSSNRPSEGALNLILVGSLIPIKGIEYAIAALEELKRRGCDLRLTIVGDGPLRYDLEQTTREKDLGDVVSFLGGVPQKELFKLYADHDVLLVCSRGEGRSSVVAEAMNAGLIIVASRVVGVSELLVGSVNEQYLYTYADVAELCDNFSRLCGRPNIVQMKLESQDFAKRNFPSWGRCAQSYLELFESFDFEAV